MKIERESTDLSVSVADIKQEKLEANVPESYINLYDTNIVVCKEEFCENYIVTVHPPGSLEDTVDVHVKDALFPVTLKEIVGKCIDKCFSTSTESKYLEKNNSSSKDLSVCGTTRLGASLAQLMRASNHHEENNITKSDNTSNPSMAKLENNEVHKNINNNKINKLQEKSTPLSRSVKKIQRPHKIENHKEANINISNSDEYKTNLKEAKIMLERSNMYVCTHCTFVATCKSDLDAHIRQHIDQKSCICNISDTENHLLPHYREKHFYCDHCHYNCSEKSSLVHHMKIHFGEKHFSCYLCHYKCKNNLLSQKKTKDKPFACNLCSFKCSDKSRLIYHNNIHTAKNPLNCRYKRQRNLFLNKNNDTKEKPFACNICNTKYSHRSSLYNHKRMHNKQKLYSCNNCTYKCNYKSRLAHHMQTHSDKEPFSCTVCYYKCKRKITFIRHMKAHANMKPLPCDVCDFKAPCKRSLVYHMKIHSDKVHFSCNLCHFKCNKKCGLVYHMRTHSGERPYRCEVCGFRCARKCYLKAHMKVHL